MESNSEFSKVAMDHARTPRNFGSLDSSDGHARITGPCGDTMEFWLLAARGRISQVTFITNGCGSSSACGSMATELAKGRTIPEARDIQQQDILEALGSLREEHCALLAANTLRAACDSFLKNRGPLGREDRPAIAADAYDQLVRSLSSFFRMQSSDS